MSTTTTTTSERAPRASGREEPRSEPAVETRSPGRQRGTTSLTVLALVGAASLIACGGGGSVTDAATDDVPRMDGATAVRDAGVETDAFAANEDAFIEPGCESLSCTHGACSMDSGSPECVCDAGWTGETCESFDAPDPSDTVLWLDAADADTLTFDGTSVIRWADKSPASADFVSETIATRPSFTSAIGTRPAVSFDGVDDALVSADFTGFTDQLEYTFFVVVQSESDNWILTGSRGEENLLSLKDDGGVFTGVTYRHDDMSTTHVGFTLTQHFYADGEPTLLTVQKTADETRIWSDGGYLNQRRSSPDHDGIPTAIDLVLGADPITGTEALEGKVGELIVFRSALEPAEREAVESYLSEKWLGRPAVHDPSTLGNLLGWFDATHTDRFTLVDGAVDEWGDRMGTDIESISAEAPAERPTYVADGLNGLPVVRFDGVDDVLHRQGSQAFGEEYTLVVVGVARNEESATFFAATPGVGSALRLSSTEGGAGARFSHDWPAGLESDGVSLSGGVAGAPLLAIATRSSAAVTLTTPFASGSAAATQDDIGEVEFLVGSGAFGLGKLEGDIAEILYYTNPLSEEATARLRSMLEAKWGLGD